MLFVASKLCEEFLSNSGFLALIEDSQRNKQTKGKAKSWDERFNALRSGLNIGMRDEKQKLKNRITTWKREKLEKTGLAIFDLKVDK